MSVNVELELVLNSSFVTCSSFSATAALRGLIFVNEDSDSPAERARPIVQIQLLLDCSNPVMLDIWKKHGQTNIASECEDTEATRREETYSGW